MNVRSIRALEEMTARHPALTACRADIDRACGLLVETFRSGGTLLICGNGGSAADADHIAGELAKSFLLRRPPDAAFAAGVREGLPGPDPACLLELTEALPAISLAAHGALITAVANDLGGELIFAQQVMAYGRPGDVLLGLTTSGSSANVARTFQTARLKGLRSICLTGRRAPEWLAELVGIVIAVPAAETASVQELHLPVYHALCAVVESELFAE